MLRKEWLRRRFGLTRREATVATMLADGLSYAEVAALCEVSYHTIHAHVKAIHDKTGARTTARLQAMIHAAPGKEPL